MVNCGILYVTLSSVAWEIRDLNKTKEVLKSKQFEIGSQNLTVGATTKCKIRFDAFPYFQ